MLVKKKVNRRRDISRKKQGNWSCRKSNERQPSKKDKYIENQGQASRTAARTADTVNAILVNERAEAGAHLTLYRRVVSRGERGEPSSKDEGLDSLKERDGRPQNSLGGVNQISMKLKDLQAGDWPATP